jgi:glycosyltransferase involved in cell wall biosynthesis
VSEKAGGSVRVLVVGQGPPTTGGIPTFVTGLVNDETLQGDFDLDYLNTTPQGTKRPGSFALSNFTLLARHAAAVFKRGRKADVVHLNLAPAPLLPLLRAIVLVVAAKLARTRVVLHAHTGRMHIAAESGLYRFALRIALRLVDEMIVVSERAVEATRSVGHAATYLPNGIDFSSIRTGPKEDRPPSLVFVGTVCERKGLLDLRAALSGLQDKDGALPLSVRILGDARQEGPGVFERIVADYRSHGLDDVEFVGSVDRAQVLETLGRSNIFCLPSHWEGFPLSLLEGMAASCAVVATDVGDVADMLDGGNAGVVVPLKDPVALQEALTELVEDSGRRDQLGAAARERVETHYSQSKMVSKLTALYEKWGRHST